MANFRFVQRGNFNGKENGCLLDDGVVDLQDMGSTEFECGAIPKAYRRLMWHFQQYNLYPTGICTPEGHQLIVFCRDDRSDVTIRSIQEFVANPRYLQERSELEKIPKAKADDTSYDRRNTDFWWCIDSGNSSDSPCDWMAFLEPQMDIFINAISSDYNDWWMQFSPEKRKEEYEKSRRW